MKAHLPTRRLLLLVCLLAAGVHANTFGNDFALDDVHIIAGNENVHGIEHLSDAVSSPYWTTDVSRIGLYRPWTSGMFAIQWELTGGNPAVFHLLNVLLHVLVTALVFALVYTLYPSSLAATAAAAVFAVHPVHVEAVANVVGQGELWAAAFVLSGCLAYLRLPAGALTTIAVAVAYFLGLASKEIAVTLPAVLILLELTRHRLHPTRAGAAAESNRGGTADGVAASARPVGARWPLFIALGVVLAGYLVIRRAVLGEWLGSGMSPWYWGEPASTRLLTAVRVWSEYLRLMLFPMDLSVDWGPNVISLERTLSTRVLGGLLVGLGAVAAAAYTWSRARLISVGILWFGITILPVTNLLFATGILLAERTLYLPSVGLAVAIAGSFALVRRERPKWIPAAAIVALVAVALGATHSWGRGPVWKDDSTALNRLIQDHPASYRAQWVLGEHYLQEGDLEEGFRRLRVASRLAPGYYSLRYTLGLQLFNRGRFAEAAENFDAARHILPELENPHILFLTSLVQTRETNAALDVAPDMVQRFPGSGPIHHFYSIVLARAGQYEAAALQRRAAIRSLRPHWEGWVHLAYLDLLLADSSRAASALDSARSLAPEDAQIPTFVRLRNAAARRDTTLLPYW